MPQKTSQTTHAAHTRGLVLAKYGTLAASTRQRFVQTIPYLNEAGIALDIHPLFDNNYLEDLFLRGKRNPLTMLRAYLKRAVDLLQCNKYDFLWIQYDLFPYLPGIAESVVRLYKKPILVDYDDAIFHQYDDHPNPRIRSIVAHKLVPLLKRADLVMCGNSYLQQYVQQYCPRTEIIPTVVDISTYAIAAQKPPASKPTVGWIGSPSTWKYCQPMTGMLQHAVQSGHLSMLVIGAGPAADKRLPFTFREWEEAREIADIQHMDIGIMPLPDEPWAHGKCGYKLIQYMACGLPVIASPVGVNSTIVQHGVNGFLATTPEEWRIALTQLLGDADLRKRMGTAGRATVEQHYSIQRYGPRIAQLIQELLASHA